MDNTQKTNENQGIVKIHGKDYMTVAGRVALAHEQLKTISITTEIVSSDPVVIRATVVTEKGTFNGTSAANPSKVIEMQNPYEVAETSAIGRALGFAGFGIVESIATADEMFKAGVTNVREAQDESPEEKRVCMQHGEPITMLKGKSKSTGREYWWHKGEEGKICFGSGWKE